MLLGNGNGSFEAAANRRRGDCSCLRGGRGLQRRRQARPGRGQCRLATTCRSCWAMARAASRRRRISRWDQVLPPWRLGTSTATASPTWPWPTTSSNNVSVLLGNGTGSFGGGHEFRCGAWSLLRGGRGLQRRRQARPRRGQLATPTTCRSCWAPAPAASRRRRTSPWGLGPRSVAVGDFNGDGKLDLAVANASSDNVSILLGTGTGSFGAATNFDVGTDPRLRGGRGLQRRRQARPGRGE